MHSLSIDIKNLNFSYEEKPIIENWSAEIKAGQIIHLCGANGSGKSTLLKLLAGILVPDSGKMSEPPKTSYIGHQIGLHPDLTLFENILLNIEKPKTQEIDSLLESANLSTYRHIPCRKLSLGQKHKVACIGMILDTSLFWLLDEPFANLDHLGEQWLWPYLEKHVSNGGILIFTAHQRNFESRGVTEWHL